MTLFDLVRPFAAVTAVAALCAPSAVHAGRPMAADDAVILDEASCELQSALDRLGWYAMPACGVGGWELGAGALRQQRHGALLLQAKTLLRPLQTDGWGVALVLSGQGGADRGAGVNLPLTASLWRDALLVHANAGAQRAGTGGGVMGTWALGAELALGARSAVTMEAYGSGTQAAKRYARLGARHTLLPGRLDVDIAYTRGIDAAASGVVVGMTVGGWSLR